MALVGPTFTEPLVDSGGTLLSMLTFSPLFGVLFLALIPAERLDVARRVAFFISAFTFALSLKVLASYQIGAGMQRVELRPWYPALGIRYLLGIDGISLWLVLLTTFLTMLVIIASGSVHQRVRSYLACLLLLEVGMLGTFLSLDGVTFYVFWELMLIPMYFLIGIWGGKNRLYAALKFVLYTAAGSLLMLVGIVYLGIRFSQELGGGEMSFLLSDWVRLSPHLSWQEQVWLFAAFALAFSIKIPLFPLHTWLPDAHVEAPTGGSVILAGVLLKMGLYGLLRFCVPVFPFAVYVFAPAFAVLGVVGILYGALVAWVQTDMKKLVAYSSVSHLGFCVLGFAALNPAGLQGALLQMLNHGVSTAALFFLVGVLYDRRHTRVIAEYGGLAAKIPVFAAVFLVFTLSSIGLPLTNGFIGEFLIMFGGFSAHRYLGSAAVFGVVLGAVYMLSLYRRVTFGPFDPKKNGELSDLTLAEKCVFAPLLVLVFLIGLSPSFLLRYSEPETAALLRHIDQRFGVAAPAGAAEISLQEPQPASASHGVSL